MRCAIYTRKSSEEGLEQEFNSLHAQREACEAYIKSQKHEGWITLPDQYDDGGYSGGSMERPALQKLLEDISVGKVDIVIVYKVDRLTRSLSDFARIIDIFDERSVSFVSVTQQFNTTTSMGRLTLNVLLSFAQFEREVTGERIRDKIAASKKKGMWMGGNIPMGYDVKDRKLVIMTADADIVRELFRLYIDLKSTRAVCEEAQKRGYRTPSRITKAGNQRGGHLLSIGHVDHILTSPIYIGLIQHKGESHEGEHEAILDRETWDAAQAVRNANRKKRRSKTNVKNPSLLGGLLFDPNGEPMTPTHAVKHGKRYRYYASKSLIMGKGGPNSHSIRVPAGEIESLVVKEIVKWFQDAGSIIDGLGGTIPDDRVINLVEKTKELADEIAGKPIGDQASLANQICKRIEVRDEGFVINLSSVGVMKLVNLLGQTATDKHITINVPAKIVRVGGETRILTPEDEAQTRNQPDPAIVRVLAFAHDWKEQLTSGRVRSINDIARKENMSPRYVSRLLSLGFLAPQVIEELLEGKHSVKLNSEKLTRFEFVSLIWQKKGTSFFFKHISE